MSSFSIVICCASPPPFVRPARSNFIPPLRNGIPPCTPRPAGSHIVTDPTRRSPRSPVWSYTMPHVPHRSACRAHTHTHNSPPQLARHQPSIRSGCAAVHVGRGTGSFWRPRRRAAPAARHRQRRFRSSPASARRRPRVWRPHHRSCNGAAGNIRPFLIPAPVGTFIGSATLDSSVGRTPRINCGTMVAIGVCITVCSRCGISFYLVRWILLLFPVRYLATRFRLL
jgi:hypothetical protein